MWLRSVVVIGVGVGNTEFAIASLRWAGLALLSTSTNMKNFKAWATAALGLGFVWATAAPARAEWAPGAVVNSVYEGIQQIHGYRATPRLIWNLRVGDRGACGPIRGTHYCTLNHTVYITQQDVKFAYQHGDAALAYIVAHEYAHAMQVAHGFMPRTTKLSELQADCLAGVYLGVIPNLTLDQKDVQEIASFAYRIGDYSWGSAHHHGTPTQRVKAVLLGMRSSAKGKGVAACRA